MDTATVLLRMPPYQTRPHSESHIDVSGPHVDVSGSHIDVSVMPTFLIKLSLKSSLNLFVFSGPHIDVIGPHIDAGGPHIDAGGPHL